MHLHEYLKYPSYTKPLFFAGDIPFWEFPQQMDQIEHVLRSSQYINNDSIQFWHADFQMKCCGKNPDLFCLDEFDFEAKYTCEDGK